MIVYLQAQALQINRWGTLRSTMQPGDQIIFRKGMPFYFDDTSGKSWKATLDATYVYECMYTATADHDQVLDGVKIDSTNVVGFNTGTNTVDQGVSVNYGFTWSKKDTSLNMLYTYPNKNYSYTIEEYSLGANGYRVSGEVEDVKNIVAGDTDGDYLMNKNDIALIRKQLVNLIAVSDVAYADANGKDEITTADLVHAKKNWDNAEPETYTTLYEDVVIPSGNLAGGSTTTIQINKDLGKAGYLRFTYQSTADLYGTIYYTYNGNEYSENFYLSKDDVQFEQFLETH